MRPVRDAVNYCFFAVKVDKLSPERNMCFHAICIRSHVFLEYLFGRGVSASRTHFMYVPNACDMLQIFFSFLLGTFRVNISVATNQRKKCLSPLWTLQSYNSYLTRPSNAFLSHFHSIQIDIFIKQLSKNDTDIDNCRVQTDFFFYIAVEERQRQESNNQISRIIILIVVIIIRIFIIVDGKIFNAHTNASSKEVKKQYINILSIQTKWNDH